MIHHDVAIEGFEWKYVSLRIMMHPRLLMILHPYFAIKVLVGIKRYSFN